MSSSSLWIVGKCFGQRVEVFGVADAGHDVFALRVDEEVAVGLVLAGRRVAGEPDAGAGVVVAVAEHHRLHVDRGAEVVADALAHAVRDRRVRRSSCGTPPRSRRCSCTIGSCGNGLPVVLARRRPCTRSHSSSQRRPRGSSASVVAPSHSFAVSSGSSNSLAVDVEHDAPVHRDEPAVRVVREPLVVGLLGEPSTESSLRPEVEDGVHHPGHRELGARAHAHEQRIAGVAEACGPSSSRAWRGASLISSSRPSGQPPSM